MLANNLVLGGVPASPPPGPKLPPKPPASIPPPAPPIGGAAPPPPNPPPPKSGGAAPPAASGGGAAAPAPPAGGAPAAAASSASFSLKTAYSLNVIILPQYIYDDAHKYIMKTFNQWQFEQSDPTQPDVPVATSAPEGVDAPEVVDSTPSKSTSEPSLSRPRTKTPKLKIKPWKASKEQIMSYWRGLQPDVPLALKPIEYDHEGSTIQEDGIRVTGSKEFITTVLSRLKDFLTYENPETKLMVAYRQSPKSFVPGNRNSFSFYLQAKKRGKN